MWCPGMGNAMVDVLAHADEAFLEALRPAQGSHDCLVDADRVAVIQQAMSSAVEMSGGSVGNT